MVATIDSSYVNQFSDNLHVLVEQKMSKTRGIFPTEYVQGENAFFDRLGDFSATEITQRLQLSNAQDPLHSRRMAPIKKFEATTYFDDIDKMKLLIDPTSSYVQGLARAHGKAFDDAVFEALLGSAATGKNGTGSQAFDSNMQIAHGSTGFTVSKFNQALKLLEENEVDIEPGNLVLFLGADGVEDLMEDTNNRFTSFDFMDGKPLSSGQLPMFRGVEIVRTQRVPKHTAGSVARGILCSKNSLRVALHKDLEIKTGELPDRGFNILMSVFMAYGMVRMEEASVADILYTYS